MVIVTNELADKDFVRNSLDRCYYCKRALFGKLARIQKQIRFSHIVDGSTVSDLSDHRPGDKAKRVFAVRSPLQEAGFTKDDVRAHLRRLMPGVYARPATVCLASRIPYGSPITPRDLRIIEKGEEILASFGFVTSRLRHYRTNGRGTLARIEVEPQHAAKAFKVRSSLVCRLKTLGYDYVTLDLEGFRTGSMNIPYLKKQ
jgi:uncharacterized protein